MIIANKLSVRRFVNMKIVVILLYYCVSSVSLPQTLEKSLTCHRGRHCVELETCEAYLSLTQEELDYFASKYKCGNDDNISMLCCPINYRSKDFNEELRTRDLRMGGGRTKIEDIIYYLLDEQGKDEFSRSNIEKSGIRLNSYEKLEVERYSITRVLDPSEGLIETDNVDIKRQKIVYNNRERDRKNVRYDEEMIIEPTVKYNESNVFRILKPEREGRKDETEIFVHTKVPQYEDMISIFNASILNSNIQFAEQTKENEIGNPQEQPANNKEITVNSRDSFPKTVAIDTDSILAATNAVITSSNGTSVTTENANIRNNGSPFPRPPDCGMESTKNFRIVDGNDAALGKFPWMAALWYSRSSLFKCGGSIITSRHVLTAAHCILPDLLLVRVGDLDLKRTDEGATPIDILIKRAMRHEMYYQDTAENDIGVLLLEETIQFTDLIKPICLPSVDFQQETFVGQTSFVAGWGSTTLTGPASDILQYVPIIVRNLGICRTRLESNMIDDRMLCVGGGSTADSCTGDSGGPLMWLQMNRMPYYQIGVVSYGRGCGNPDFPAVYTRVDRYVTWLERKVLEMIY